MRPSNIRFLAPIALLLCSTSAFAQTGPWTVSEVKGQVTVEDSQGKRLAKRGTRVLAGGSVEVGPKGKAILVRDREFVTVKASSRIRFTKGEEARSIMQVLQDWGTAVFNIGKQEKPHFGVQTPYLAAVVKGTTFTITVTQAGASMQVTEGAVEVQTLDGGAIDLVLPGAIAIVGADDRFRLTVEGSERKVIDSPNRVSNGAGAKPSPAAGTSGAMPATGVPAQTAQTITSTFVASGENIAEMSNGLVTGTTRAAQFLFAARAEQENAEKERVLQLARASQGTATPTPITNALASESSVQTSDEAAVLTTAEFEAGNDSAQSDQPEPEIAEPEVTETEVAETEVAETKVIAAAPAPAEPAPSVIAGLNQGGGADTQATIDAEAEAEAIAQAEAEALAAAEAEALAMAQAEAEAEAAAQALAEAEAEAEAAAQALAEAEAEAAAQAQTEAEAEAAAQALAEAEAEAEAAAQALAEAEAEAEAAAQALAEAEAEAAAQALAEAEAEAEAAAQALAEAEAEAAAQALAEAEAEAAAQALAEAEAEAAAQALVEGDNGWCLGSICFDGNGLLDQSEIDQITDKIEELAEDAEEDIEEIQNGNGNNGNGSGDTGGNDSNDDDNNGSDDNNGNDDD